MKKIIHLYPLLLLIISFIAQNNTFSQSVGINTTGSNPNSSALLDIDASGMNPKKGLLIPRMTTTDRDGIVSPAEGLQIFNTTSKCLEVYAYGFWQSVYCACSGYPAQPGAITGTSSVCQNQNGTAYSVPYVAGVTYAWSYTGTGFSCASGCTGNSITADFSGSATSGTLTATPNSGCGNGPSSTGYAITVSPVTSINSQPPSPAVLCAENGIASFTVGATGSSLTYQWQEYTSSWTNISNGGVYSGATAATLTITNPTTGMSGYKYRCVATGTCGSATSDGNATMTVYDFSNGLVGYWPMEGNSNDLSGNNNNGSDNAVSYSSSTGKYSEGESLNGTSSYTVIPSSSSLNVTSDISIAFWIKSPTGLFSGSAGYLLQKDDVTTNRDYEGAVTSEADFFFFINNSSYSSRSSSGANLQDGNWHHVIGVRTGSDGVINLYIDGTLKNGVQNHTASGNLNQTGSPLYIGKRNYGPDPGYTNCYIDEIRIYNRALSTAEAAALYSGTPCP